MNRSAEVLCVGVVLAAALVCPSGEALADNLLTNADFKQGKPRGDDFAWSIEPAKNQGADFSVVEGRTPDTTALRVYRDELGRAQISQKIKVEPWQWYVATIWVNSENMAAFDFAPFVNLEGGRRVTGDRFHNDTFEWPKKGWRRINVLTHSAAQEHITLYFGGGGIADRGGGGWSGELLFSDPVVRECGIVEAAATYPTARARWVPMYAADPDAEAGDHGFAIQKGDIFRIIEGFPNPLYITGRMNSKAPRGGVSLALPPGVRFRVHQDRKVKVEVSAIPNGFQRVELPAGQNTVVVDSALAVGERAVGYVQLEWDGGSQFPTPVHFEGIAFPDATAPKRAMTMLDLHGHTFYQWHDDQAATARALKRFGFNHLEVWSGDARPFPKAGLHGVTVDGQSFYVDSKRHPEAVAVMMNGLPCPGPTALMALGYRGAAMQPRIDRIKSFAAMSSALTLDEEFYSSSALSPTIGFHPDTLERWNEWVAENHPDLADVDPKVFARRPHKYRRHYDAWLDFRCDLVAERYAILRDAFHKAVEDSGVKTTPRPMLGAYIGGGPLVGIHSNKALASALDYIANMVYDDAPGLREKVARLAPVSDKKLVVAIAPGYQVSPPGDARSGVLEAVMGGSQGFIAWGYNHGMTAGHLADMADAIKMFVPVVDVILDGELVGGYVADRESVNLSVRRLGDVDVLLVSDYSPEPGNGTITVPGDEELEVTDLFADKIVARLDSGNRGFPAELRRDLTARLYRLSAPK